MTRFFKQFFMGLLILNSGLARAFTLDSIQGRILDLETSPPNSISTDLSFTLQISCNHPRGFCDEGYASTSVLVKADGTFKSEALSLTNYLLQARYSVSFLIRSESARIYSMSTFQLGFFNDTSEVKEALQKIVFFSLPESPMSFVLADGRSANTRIKDLANIGEHLGQPYYGSFCVSFDYSYAGILFDRDYTCGASEEWGQPPEFDKYFVGTRRPFMVGAQNLMDDQESDPTLWQIKVRGTIGYVTSPLHVLFETVCGYSDFANCLNPVVSGE